MKFGPMLSKAEAEALATCVKELPINPVIVQIGANTGLSTVAIMETRPDAFIFSLDVKPYPAEKQNLIEAGLNHRQVVRILGDSKEIDWPFPVDMIYFDGDHRYKGIKADCKNWLGHIKPDGFAVFHDYIGKDAPPKNQVKQVVDEYFNAKNAFVRKERMIGFKI